MGMRTHDNVRQRPYHLGRIRIMGTTAPSRVTRAAFGPPDPHFASVHVSGGGAHLKWSSLKPGFEVEGTLPLPLLLPLPVGSLSAVGSFARLSRSAASSRTRSSFCSGFARQKKKPHKMQLCKTNYNIVGEPATDDFIAAWLRRPRHGGL